MGEQFVFDIITSIKFATSISWSIIVRIRGYRQAAYNTKLLDNNLTIPIKDKRYA